MIIFLLLLLKIVSSSTTEGIEDPHQCLEDGVCFPDEKAMGRYFGPGKYLPIDFGEDQHIAGKDWKASFEIYTKSKEYMRLNVTNNATVPDSVKKECKCRQKLCSFWAAIGEEHFWKQLCARCDFSDTKR